MKFEFMHNQFFNEIFNKISTSAHNAIIFRQYLNERFPNQWIGTHTVP